MAFRIKHCRDRIAATFPDYDNNPALAVLVPRKTTVNALLFEAGRLQIAAEVAAINLSGLTLTADDTTFHFLSHRRRQ